LVTHADTKALEKLEDQIGRVIAEVVQRMGPNRLPLRPSRRTMHPMIKAMVADPDPTDACERSAGELDPVQGRFAV
jgi:hypothetical protein